MSDNPSDEPLGFNLDLGKILKDATTPTRRRRTTTSRSRTTSSSSDMDAALRRAVRAEVDDVKRAVKDLAEEVVRLRRANEELLDKLDRIIRAR